ncbi:hypothetical protein CRE_12075 [Caenorhabditis remanei]|uniref:Uncharacterized protein n=1 Tax=Caenorhabditis remanei TaxID=31234 RepID=E3MPS4_CAERE|nr:hypothetical protein CRE_12075 [Caenorhabditis remanei]
MNRPPPLSYESLKTVLGQMDANTRFRLFSRIPSICSTDKVVPLRIQTFLAHNNSFMINNTGYEVKVYKKYPDANKSGLALTDLDQYGFKDDSGKNALTPGDVDFRDESLVTHGEPGYHQQDERIPDLEKTLEELRRKIEFVESFGPIPKVIERNSVYKPFEHQKLLKVFMKGTGNTTIERCQEFEIARKMAHLKLSGEIKNQLAKLQPFYSRRDGVPLPYEIFLQFSVTSPGQKHIERVRYSKKLHESAKYLSIRLFGNRRHPVHIKLLNLNGNGIMRLPVALRLKIEEIEALGKNIHLLQRSLVPLLDAPIKRLNTFFNEDEDFEYSILKEVRHLQVLENHPYIRPQVVLNLQNLIFHKISQFEYSWSVEDFLLVIKNWVESGKKVGSCYSFGTSEHVKNTILGKITEEYKDAETGDA